MAKLQHRSLKIIDTTPVQAYQEYNILSIDMYIERSCTSTLLIRSHNPKTNCHNQSKTPGTPKSESQKQKQVPTRTHASKLYQE